MSTVSKIEWTDRTWNPVRGCSIVSRGCVNCYAMTQAHRFGGMYRANGIDGAYTVPGPFHGLTKQTSAGPQWTGQIRTVREALFEPLSWKEPARVFVNSMSDLFHEEVPDQFIVDVFGVMALAHWHTFQVLTKRPERMRSFLCAGDHGIIQQFQAIERNGGVGPKGLFRALDIKRRDGVEWNWPLPNVWLGVSAEDQQRADERIPLLLQTPAAVRFVSAEPLLGPIKFQRRQLGVRTDCDGCRVLDVRVDEDGCCQSCGRDALSYGLDWVIVGGESGPGARRCNVGWIRSIVQQCHAASVPCFVKQLGSVVIDRNDAGFMGEWPEAWPDTIDQEDRVEHDLDGARDGYQGAPVRIYLKDRKGGKPDEWPEDLRVRQFPVSGGRA